MSFLYDQSGRNQDEKMEVGQDLSHFAHQARRSFMHAVYEYYLKGVPHEQFEYELSGSAYFQHIKRLNLKITAVHCCTTSRWQDIPQFVSVQCQVHLARIGIINDKVTLVE